MGNPIRRRHSIFFTVLFCSFFSLTAYAETFSGIAKVATPTCSSDYSRVRNCHDEALPESPSIDVNAISSGKFDSGVVDFPDGGPNAGATYVLPHHRTSNDGRVVLVAGSRPSIKILRPENIGEDYKVIGDGSKDSENLFSAQKYIQPVQMIHPQRTNLHDRTNAAPNLLHSAICDDSTTAWDLTSSNSANRNPRSCQAWVHPNGDLLKEHEAVLVSGDCYDISVVAGAGESVNSGKAWEMVANKFTVFVENPKTPSAGKGVRKLPLIYPRLNQDVLPFYGFYNAHNAHYVPATASAPATWNWRYEYARERALDICFGSVRGEKPGWCQHYDDMETSADTGIVMDYNANGRSDRNEYWDGKSGRALAMFEPAISGDGRLLVINATGVGLWYGYSNNACSIADWSNLRPVTAMPWDTRLNERYPITRALQNPDGTFRPFRNSQGQALTKPAVGQAYPMFEGAYPWIDRDVRNLFFSKVNDFRDNYRFKNVTEPCSVGTPNYLCSYNPAIANRKMSPDGRPGKGVSVVGAWTRGKIIQLDNRVNMSDFGNIEPGGGFNFNSNAMPAFEMQLFAGEPVYFQMKAAQAIQSYENLFNAYNALSPRLPFDVVWTVSSDVSQNSEVVFDEYMADNAVIVAHMNAPFTSFNCGRSDCPSFPDDGFVPNNPTKSERNDGNGSADFRFRKSPLIQNASTLEGGAIGCPSGTFRSGQRCIVSRWSSASSVYHFYLRNTQTLYIADYSYSISSAQNCPSNTRLIRRWSRGVQCQVQLPSGVVADSIYVYGDTLVLDAPASSVSIPKNLSLLGGSHVQPLGLGGVIGKGLWLDGKNDHLEARFQASATKDWFAGVWLDNRASDNNARTVFTWPDGSRVAISNSRITALQGRTGVQKTLSTSGVGLTNAQYFHFGVKSVASEGGRDLYFYINGTRTANHLSFSDSNNSFSLASTLADQRSGFWLGDPGNNGAGFPPFKGWTDELRVYAVTERERSNSSYFEEAICNMALGSMVEVRSVDRSSNNATLRGLYQKAVVLGLIENASDKQASAAVCEQLHIGSHQEPADFAPQSPANAICADRVHRNAHPELAARCLRRQFHEIEDLPTVADLPRPDFSSSAFCQSCHSDDNSLEELRMDALTAGVHARFMDERRQPMDVPAVMTGCTPTSAPFDGNCYDIDTPLLMDRLFDDNPKVQPN